MSILLFEDHHVSQLYPITIGRAAFAVSCGGFRLIDLLADLDVSLQWHVRPHLREVLQLDFPGPKASCVQAGATPQMVVNAALVPSVEHVQRLALWLRDGQPGVVLHGMRVAAAVLVRGTRIPESLKFDATPSRRNDDPPQALALEEWLLGLGLPILDHHLSLFDYPHDVVRHHPEILSRNLEYRLARGSYQQVAEGVFVTPTAKLGAYVVTDSSSGPIVIEDHAQIGPYCFLEGPAYIGRSARVIEHSAIKDAVSLGHTTKIGGEVEASIIEPYTNKQHHGFLGHSYLGSWINLGAGTCNSDLKNTYGTVRMEYQGKPVETGMQFVGAIIGDYAKSAINTGIFTGKTIGAGSMVYGFVTTNVPSFVNYARLFGQVTETPVDVLVRTQARMFARRNVVQRECDIQLLHSMYELTRNERQIAGEPLIL